MQVVTPIQYQIQNDAIILEIWTEIRMPGRGYNPSTGGHWKPEDAVVLVLTEVDAVVDSTVDAVIVELVVGCNVDVPVSEVIVEKSIVVQK